MVGIEMIRCLAGVRNISECEVNENTDSEVQCSVIAAVQCGGECYRHDYDLNDLFPLTQELRHLSLQQMFQWN